VILASGCFDGLHAGHVLYLKRSSEHRRFDYTKDRHEELFVAVACDDYIRLHKHREPRWTTDERSLAVSCILGVDGAFMHGPDGVAHVIRERKPRLFIKGLDALGTIAPDVVSACRDVECDIVFVMHGFTGKHTSDAVSAHQ
jgi:glycerol-3-phosphate cytidylyltransferase-like family protein